MAKQVYDDEKIKAIVNEIRRIVPTLNWTKFTTGNIPIGIRRVYEEGKILGYNDGERKGYDKGLLVGKVDGKNEGYADGFNEGYDKGYNEGVESSTGIELPTLTNPGTADDMLKDKQLIDGDGNIVTGTIETRTYEDLISEKGSATVTVPPGYYPVTAEKTINIEPFYYDGYNEGYRDGWAIGYYEGYDIGTNDGYDMGYDEGLEVGKNTFEDGNGVLY